MFKLTDNLPPTFVRDWWQLRRNLGYVILMVLAYVILWLTLCTTDWASVQEYMVHAYEPVDCNAGSHYCAPEDVGCEHEHYFSCYPLCRVCSMMRHLNDSIVIWAMVLVGLLIPLRVGNAVSADTRVKGTNFLQVTPLSAWRIVGGMWLSAFSQVLVFAVLALPLLAARAYLMPTGDEADWYGLFYLILAGGVSSAAFMFISGLNQFLRYLLMGVLIICGMALTDVFTSHGKYIDISDIPLWTHGVHALGAGLITLLFLQLACRPYAAPAENTTLPVRLTVAACVVFSLLCSWGACMTESGSDAPTWRFALHVAAGISGGVSVFGALMDAILPTVPLPVHAKRAFRGLPAWPQVPGFFQSAFFLILPLVAISTLIYFVFENSVIRNVEGYILNTGNYLWVPVSMFIATLLLLWVPMVFSICIGDMFVRRNSSRRPLVIALTFVVLCIIFGLISSIGVENIYLPFASVAEPTRALDSFAYCFVDLNVYSSPLLPESQFDYASIDRYAQECVTICISAAVQTAMAIGLLIWRQSFLRNQH